MVTRWILGSLVGTLLVAMTSPWFVRSYLPRVNEPTRQVNVLLPQSIYRWRSEGYATTRIGPLGMPGQQTDPRAADDAFRIALWGDSQAEGVCVDDRNKIAAFVASESRNHALVLPFARSGDNCNDWIQQIISFQSPNATKFRIDAHAFLIVEFSDWCIEIDRSRSASEQAFNKFSTRSPAFLIQAARNALTKDQDNELRTLRFRPGPVRSNDQAWSVNRQRNSSRPENQPTTFEQRRHLLAAQLDRLQQHTDVPCLFLYAPLFPTIINGNVFHDDPDSALYDALVQESKPHGFQVVDLRGAMHSSVAQGNWPRGFHNGQFGVGHYNATGNKIIANGLLSADPLRHVMKLDSKVDSVAKSLGTR